MVLHTIAFRWNWVISNYLLVVARYRQPPVFYAYQTPIVLSTTPSIYILFQIISDIYVLGTMIMHTDRSESLYLI